MAKKSAKKQRESVFAKFSLFFFDRLKLTWGLWVVLVVAGVLSYSVWHAREGFPPIQVPIGAVTGTYFVDSTDKVDRDVTQPISDALLADDRVDVVQTSATDNFFTAFVSFDEDIDNDGIRSFLEEKLGAGVVPNTVELEFLTFDPSKYLNEFDMLLSVYARDSQDLQQLEAQASELTSRFNEVTDVESSEVLSLFSTGINPFTEMEETRQSGFGRVGVKEDGQVNFYKSVTIGIKNMADGDVIELSQAVNEKIAELTSSGEFDEIGITSSADFAPQIESQIDSLQQNVLTGLLAVSIVSLLLITWRASIITAIFILSVVLTTLFVLLLIGFSINTITLFALVLSLGLFVDDATIIVEAIDAGRKKSKKARDVAKDAVSKVASASFAGTFTTILVFLPLVFVTGILGEFIRILPVTIITALIVSLVLSLTLIPFLSRFILLSGRHGKPTAINRAETWIANKLASIPLILRKNRRKGIAVSIFMFSISIFVIMSAGTFAQKLEFNIFPPSKDADQLQIEITYKPGTTIEQAEAFAGIADNAVKDVIDENLLSVAYFDTSVRSATAIVELVPFQDREVTSVQMLERLQFYSDNFQDAKIRYLQIDGGPPVEEFPFKMQLFSEDVVASERLADAIVSRIDGSEVERPNGTTANIIATNVEALDTVDRKGGRRFVEVQAAFDSDDTTALVTAAQDLIEAEFSDAKILEIAARDIDLEFDFGQESDNQDSFSSLAVVGPISVVVMFILLAIQFRSLIQPLLIFMAIPFSFFGVMYGLYITDNPISFFSMIGFFGLIGIAVNNTILLTDYANQERRRGLPLVEAISEATKKRFRPLITTSITTVAALTPLALSDPFWESLAVTIIFGLLSSTILVVISFPYYYLFAEGIRRKIRRMLGRPEQNQA